MRTYTKVEQAISDGVLRRSATKADAIPLPAHVFMRSDEAKAHQTRCCRSDTSVDTSPIQADAIEEGWLGSPQEWILGGRGAGNGYTFHCT